VETSHRVSDDRTLFPDEVTKSKVDKDTQKSQKTPVLLPTKSCKSHWPKWKKQMSHKLVICSLEVNLKCIILLIHLRTTDTMKELSMEFIVDTGTTRDFINQDFITQAKLPTQKLSQPIPVYNVDGTLNKARSIHKVVDIVVIYNQHSEHILLAVT